MQPREIAQFDQSLTLDFLAQKQAVNDKMAVYKKYGFPLSREAQHATLHAVLGNISVSDAAKIAGVSENDIIKEAQAWAVATEILES